MKNHLIEEIQVDISKSGHTTPVINCYAVAEVKIRCPENNLSLYYSLKCEEGQFHFFKTSESTYQIQIDEDREHWDKVAAGSVGSCGPDIAYEDLTHHNFFNDGNDLIWGFLIALVSTPWDVMEKMKVECVGKYLEDIEFPPIEDDRP